MRVSEYDNRTGGWDKTHDTHTLRIEIGDHTYDLDEATVDIDGVRGLRVRHAWGALSLHPEVSNSIIITPREGN